MMRMDLFAYFFTEVEHEKNENLLEQYPLLEYVLVRYHHQSE